MKSKINIIKWTFLGIFSLSMVLSYKPHIINTPGIDKSKIENTPILEKTIVVTKIKDSIQNSIVKNLAETEKKTDINSKLKEENIRLSKLENAITNQIVEDLTKQVKNKSNSKYLYFTEKNFKSIAVDYKGETYHISKDSVCTDYHRNNIFSKRKCTNYDYFLKITK